MATFHVAGQGGGCASAYHAGVIRGLQERFGFEYLGGVTGSSGIILNWAYVISGQIDLIAPIWRFLFRSGKFITPLKHPTGRGVMDIDFLVDKVIYQGELALDLSGLQQSPVIFNIGLTDAQTGASVFFSKRDKVSFYELIRATCAVPYFGNSGPVKIYHRSYYDGTIGSVLGLEQIRDERNLLIILTRPYRPLAQMIIARKVLRRLLLRGESRELQEAIWSMPARYNETLRQIPEIMRGKMLPSSVPKKNCRFGGLIPVYRVLKEPSHKGIRIPCAIKAWKDFSPGSECIDDTRR